MRKQLRTLLLIGIALPRLAQAVDNSWTNVNAGKWETNSNWSLGVAPAITQSFIYITNAPSKTVTIDAVTSGSFPATLSISNLVLFAPAGSFNTLTVNNAGTGTPLRVLSSMFLNGRATLNVLANSVVELAGGSFVLGVGGTEFGSTSHVNLFGGGSLIATNGTLLFGSPGDGDLLITNGTLRALGLSLGNLG